ncbi:unnamed protein product, partial [marine sediment metagenome]
MNVKGKAGTVGYDLQPLTKAELLRILLIIEPATFGTESSQ